MAGLGDVLAGQEDRGVAATIRALEELRVLRYRSEQDAYEVGLPSRRPRVGFADARVPVTSEAVAPPVLVGAEALRATIDKHLGRRR